MIFRWSSTGQAQDLKLRFNPKCSFRHRNSTFILLCTLSWPMTHEWTVKKCPLQTCRMFSLICGEQLFVYGYGTNFFSSFSISSISSSCEFFFFFSRFSKHGPRAKRKTGWEQEARSRTRWRSDWAACYDLLLIHWQTLESVSVKQRHQPPKISYLQFFIRGFITSC